MIEYTPPVPSTGVPLSNPVAESKVTPAGMAPVSENVGVGTPNAVIIKRSRNSNRKRRNSHTYDIGEPHSLPSVVDPQIDPSHALIVADPVAAGTLGRAAVALVVRYTAIKGSDDVQIADLRRLRAAVVEGSRRSKLWVAPNTEGFAGVTVMETKPGGTRLLGW